MSYRRPETRSASTTRWTLFLVAFLILRAFSARADWVAYHDLWAGPGTHPNTTVWNPFGTAMGGAPTSGPLTNIQTGARLPVTLTGSYSGDARVSSMAGVAGPSTPAYQTFNGYVDWNTAYGSGSVQNTAQFSSAGAVTWTFTGLDPARRYSLKGTSVRGDPTYTNRWTLCEIQGADSFTSAHTSGVLTSNQLSGQLTASQAVFQTGDNTAGEMVVWANIAPGADGSFAVMSTRFGGTIPGASTAGTSGYALTFLRLEELAVAPPPGIWVDANGHTNSFATRPPVAEWSTRASDGSASTLTTVAAVDNAVQTNVAAAINLALVESSGNPAGEDTLAVWSSGGFLQTRPRSIAYTVLMATLVNNTGEDAGALRVRYDWFTNNATGEALAGHRAYYSLTGAAGSWTPIPELSLRPAGTLDVTLALPQSWAHASRLYLLWADANASVTDLACQIDNFYVAALRLGLACSLSAPTNGAVLGVPAHITVSASISGQPTHVEFYADGSLIGSRAGSPYTLTWTNPPLGSHQLLAVAWSSSGAVTSAPVNVTVVPNSPPAVTLTSPLNGAVFGTPSNTAPIAMSATASDSDGTVTNVEFYGDGALLGSDATSPFAFTWASAPLGNHQLTAVATDNGGLRATSAVINITVSVLITGIRVPPSGVTNTFDALPAATEWSMLNVTGNAPSSSNALDIAVQSNAATNVTSALGTQTSYANSGNANWNSTARTIYTAPTGNAYTLLMATLRNDTGANISTFDLQYDLIPGNTGGEQITNHHVYYSLTGAAGTWVNIPALCEVPTAGTLTTSVTLAGSWAHGTALYLLWADPNASGFTDPYYAIDNFSVRPLLAPGVFLTAPTNGAVVGVPGLVLLAASVVGVTATNVEFYANGALVGATASVPYRIAWNDPPLGSNQLLAVAWHGSGAVTSAPVNVTVLPNSPPAVTLSSPAGGAVFWTSSNAAQIVMSATATDSDGTVTNVDFYGSGAWLGSDSTSPFAFTWPNASLGSNHLVAVATDNGGLRATSAPVSISVRYRATWPGFAVTNFKANITVSSLAIAEGVITNAAQQSAVYSEIAPVLNCFSTEADGHYTGNRTFPGLTMNVDVDNFVVEARATITIPAAGEWTFGVNSDDGFGLQIGTFSMSYPGPRGAADTLQTFNFNTPGDYPLRLVYFEYISGAELELFAVQGTAGSWNTNFRLVGDTANGGLAVNSEPSGGLTIQLTSPTNGSLFTLGAPITLAATAASGTGAVSQVAFYSGAGWIGSDPTAPYSVVWSNAPLGTNPLYAVASDDSGQNATSAVVRVVVMNPGVFLTAPAEGAVFTNTNPITVTASVVPEGAITNMEFLVDGVKFGEDATAPYSAAWNTVSGGSHRLTAVGRTAAGTAYLSPAVNIAVAQLLVPRGAVWKYLDNGSDQGTAWRAPGFDDSGWTNGPAELGYGDGDEATVVNSGPSGAFYITTYFRRSFVLTNAAGYTNVLMNVKRDDGAVVYLNGVEAARFNMPAGDINYLTTTANATDDGATFWPATAPASLLVEGTNVIAVELHQSAASSSDVSFNLDLSGIPIIIRNQFPAVALTSPTNTQYFLAPPSLLLEATASDPDGSLAKVEFFADNQKLGETTAEPYSFAWNNPPLGEHVLTAVATDNQGAASTSVQVAIVVYDDVGRPVVRITSPSDGAILQGPTNLLVTATAQAILGVTNVQFLANGVEIGNDPVAPYSVVWPSSFLSNGLVAIAYDAGGVPGTSAVVSLFITIPPTNLVAPAITTQVPLGGTTVTSLTSISITFSERVQNVDAADLLINGTAASQVTAAAGGSNYLFTFSQPAYGQVAITWATNHGITDYGWPSNLPFDGTGTGATWSYNLVDTIPPVVAAKQPPAGAIVTNLTVVNVIFNKTVTGVDAVDFLVNGAPAFGLSGGGSNYTFSFAQPSAGPVTISWAVNHGITDLATSPNAFNAGGAGATWSYTLDLRTILVQSNSTWRFLKGTAEASTPMDAWRQRAFDDSGWSNAPAPFFFGDPYSNGVPAFTLLTDMQGNYSSIYLRQPFTLTGASSVSNLFLVAQSDDGFIAWINGVEVLRYNVPGGDVPYNGVASASGPEPQNRGAAYLAYTLNNPAAYLVEGQNVLAVHAFNVSLAQSTDFGFNAQLYTYVADPSAIPPVVSAVVPAAGTVFALSNITVAFSEPVSGVDAADLLVNGVPATSLSSTTNTTYAFGFTQPPFGPVSITWAVGPGITDFDDPPKAFDGSGPGATFSYSLLNPNAPTVASQTPLAGATVNSLTQVTVAFSKAVTGVDAADLRINGVPATSVSGGPVNYVFTFPQPAYGPVSIGWATITGITDTEPEPNAFEGTRAGNTWTYTLVDQTPPAVASQNPPAGAQVTNLTQVTVTFTEAVSGVNASDLLVNGVPASTLQPFNASTYLFTFAQPNATIVNVTWATAHGIRDLAVTPNAFNANASESTWSYTTPDNVPPGLASLSPPAGATLRSLLQITVVFTETVTGVDTNDLLLNHVPARQVSGSGAGPYTFAYSQPSNGPVTVRWSATRGITDLATPPNAFAGGEWTYLLDPNASFAGKILINELMFNSPGGNPTNEWIELYNVGSEVINLAGWHFTRGLEFTFPNVAMPAGGYLVVAADPDAFLAQYPDVANVVGGWTGRLADNGETLEIVSAQGEVVDRVRYASEGDWARRERGHGAALVEEITRSGNTATVRLFGHDYTANDRVLISGADQPEYNGIFVVNSPGSATFNITVPGTPETPATGRIICRQVIDSGQSGWSWFSAADGFGHSLELVNPALPNDVGQNWLASGTPDGTPGRANSVLSTNVAPFILEVTHFPPVPRSTDAVTISARVSDAQSNGVQSVTLFYRNHTTTSPGPFASTNMFDDGAHNDGGPRDGLYATTLEPQANRNVMEFYVEAMGPSGLIRTWPAATWETNNTSAQLANALYQVDDESLATNMPFLRLIMTGSERAVFPPSDSSSDAEMNATFISIDGDGTQVRYNAGVRIRGAGSRGGDPRNFRVNLPNDHWWNNRSRMNLNSRYVHAQLAGSALAQRAGLPSADARVVQVRVNGQNLGSGISFGCYVLVEPMNGDWAANHFPLDPDGNVYRGSKYPWTANLDYQGTNAATYHGQTGLGYYKASNGDENDWTDLMRLTYALSPNTSDAAYVSAVQTNANVEEWLLYFMVCNFFDYQETSLCNGVGDDYAMYRGVVDPRFRLVAHDFDTILGQGDTGGSTSRSIWYMVDTPKSTDPATRANFLSRFMRHPEFAPIYFRLWKQHLDTTFRPEQVHPLLDEVLGGWVTGNTLPNMKAFVADRRAFVLTQIPTNLTVATTLDTQNGYLYTISPNVTLNGQANIIDTRRVLVNGSAATWTAWQGRWTHTVTLPPGINRVLVQSLDSNQVAFASATVEIWYDDSSVQNVSGAVATDTVWNAANGPYQVTANLTVNAGVTLSIQPGTTVYLGSGVDLTVANGGTLIAAGTPTAPIRFTRVPGTPANWGGITINGGVGSPETRIAYAHLEANGSTAIHASGGTVFLDHLTFGNPAVQYLALDGASFVVQDCVFPATTASFEPVHGTGGIKADGRGIFLRNFFGPITGYNDTIDFTGGHRPGPIVQFLNNVFMGSGDDNLDLDNTDAWVEGNLFLHVHKNGSPDTSSAISGGSDTGESSDVTIIGNIIYDCDHAALAKQGNYFTFLNNTIVRQSHAGGSDTEGAVVCLADNNMSEGAGAYFEANILYDIEALTRDHTNAIVTFTNNLMPLAWSGPGGNNSNADPLLKYIPQLAETTNFTSWAAAQVLWDWFSLRTGSPASGAGPNGRDLGAVAATRNSELGTRNGVRGVSVSGEPASPTPQPTATLTIGVNLTGSGMTSVRWPDGSGFTHYRWRLDAGVWSAETSLGTPITLTGLSAGPHYVEVVGKNDAGFYQNDAVFGPDAVITVSRSWTVDPTASPLRLNEVLASNGGAVDHFGTTPDLIELYNASDASQSLAGVRLTDDPADPDKFLFPPGAAIGPREYLVLYANNPNGTPGYHLGFNLAQEGEAVFLYDTAERGGALLDAVRFGPQLTDLSIGRLADDTWALTQPTFGAANRAAQVGDPSRLHLNEWLALGVTPFNGDFVELYNADALPVSLGGLYLSDEILGWRDRHEIPTLSFIAGQGYLRFFADGDPSQGPVHLNFGLSGDQGAIGLYWPDLTPIDQVTYLAQWPNISQGRSPNGGSAIVFFSQPTPGAPNPFITGPAPNGGVLVLNEVLANNGSLIEAGRTPDWVELYNGTTNQVDLGGMGLTDETSQPRRFVIPAGTALAPGAFLRVLCDPGATNLGPLVNTNFALKSSGGGVYLFDGSNLVSAITYGLQVADLSIGRVPDGSTNWFLCGPTPEGVNRTVASLGDPANLKVNEWMADPGPGNDDWFELYNPDPQPVALGGLYLTDDLNNRTKHRIAALSFLGTGTNAWQKFVADNNTGAGADHVNFALRAAGEAVGLFATNGALIHSVVFLAQQEGVSEGCFPDGATNVVAFPRTGSPGASNWRQLTDIVITEALTHTDEPLEDAIELHNVSSRPVDVGGWWLSDDAGTLRKYQIPAPRILPPFGFTVIYENEFTNREIAVIPFALSSRGDEIVLSAATNNALTGWRAKVDFGPAANGVSFGRYVTSDQREQFVAMSTRTLGVDDPGSVAEFRTGTGQTNTYPRVGPVVISEIMYHPPDLATNDNTRDEFIELRNITTAPVALCDGTNGWHLRDAVDYDFPPGIVIQPGDYLLVVGFDPVNNPAALAAFRATYRLDPSVRLMGPWSGKLANDTEDIELRRPDTAAAGDVPYLLVERVRYSDAAPWPPAADGTGYSLQRLADDQFANDPINWTAATPTPGPQAAPIDSDGDGMPDPWESLHGLDPFNPNDAALDADGDGLTNLQEFQLDTDPRDPTSGLRLNIALAPDGTHVVLSYAAAAEFAYGLEYAETLDAPWQPLQDFPAAATNRLVQHSVPVSSPMRFYRLRLQASPSPAVLRLISVGRTPGDHIRLTFTVPAYRSCTVLFTPALSGAPWTQVTSYPAVSTNQVIQLETPASDASGFFRLRSP